MKKNKLLKNVVKAFFTIICILIVLFINKIPTTADVGSFETYSSDRSSSYSSESSYSDRIESSGSSSRFTNPIDTVLSFIIFMIVIVIAVIGTFFESMWKAITLDTKSLDFNDEPNKNEEKIQNRIKSIEPNYNNNDFKLYVKNVFIQLQNAWTDRNWEEIRNIETNELYEQHKAQLDGYIKNNQINVMKDIQVRNIKIVEFTESGEEEVLKVELTSKMKDYIIDATTKEIVRGNKDTAYVNTYVLKFFRTKGENTPEGGMKANTINCPNCGAPTKVMTSGKCEYCGSVITSSKHGWALGSLERKRPI